MRKAFAFTLLEGPKGKGLQSYNSLELEIGPTGEVAALKSISAPDYRSQPSFVVLGRYAQ
jgi:hypothetical protein